MFSPNINLPDEPFTYAPDSSETNSCNISTISNLSQSSLINTIQKEENKFIAFDFSPTNNKITSEDFKAKYKTELCKFWEINKTCKYGDNVSKIL